MWRLIFLGLIIWLGFSLFKRNTRTPIKPKEAESSPKPNPIENMVQCAHCAVHLPRSEAFLVNNKFYCSQAHIQNQ